MDDQMLINFISLTSLSISAISSLEKLSKGLMVSMNRPLGVRLRGAPPTSCSWCGGEAQCAGGRRADAPLPDPRSGNRRSSQWAQRSAHAHSQPGVTSKGGVPDMRPQAWTLAVPDTKILAYFYLCDQ